jgi:pyruvate dehydrogenase E1 component
VLAVTSADRLNAGWTAAQRARARGNAKAEAHVETLLKSLPRHCRIVTVIDGHPATLSWLGAVVGHQAIPLGVEHFGQTGTIGDLYRHYGIDAASIVAKVEWSDGGKTYRLIGPIRPEPPPLEAIRELLPTASPNVSLPGRFNACR